MVTALKIVSLNIIIYIICMPERVKLLGFRVFRLLMGTLKVQSRINIFLRIKVVHFISGSVDGI